MDELKELNRLAIYEKLDRVGKIANCYVVNDLIEAVSTHKERDSRIVNGWPVDEVILQKTVRNASAGKVLRSVRLFTTKGISRYLDEGKIYSYENVCKYFNIKPIDKELEQLKKELSSMSELDQYNTTRILKWLFMSRVQAKALGDYTTTEKLKEWLNTCDKDTSVIDKKKLQLLDIELDVETNEETEENELEIEI